MSFAKKIAFVAVLVLAPTVASAANPQISGESRWANFQDAESQYFALSVQADARADYPQAEAYEVVVLFDTSASQTGPVRIAAMEVLAEISDSLSPAARVSLIACDVESVDLSGGLVAATDSKWATAIGNLKKRIPLGTTDLSGALTAAAAQFDNANAQKTILYIGDGVNRSNFITSAEHRKLITGLVEQEISVSALAIGPFVDYATLASLSNQTGGIVLTHSQLTESNQSVGRYLAHSTSIPVLWVSEAELPKSLASHFPNRFPPIRLDRDTVVVGQLSGEAQAGQLKISARCASQPVELALELNPEASNPDMGFLAAVVDLADKDGGLTLPALGSEGLRAMSFQLADSAEAMVKSGRFALQAGQTDSAVRIAKEALKSDPNSVEAMRLLRAAEGDNGTEIPAGKFMQFGGDSPENGIEYDNGGDLLAEQDQMRRVTMDALKADIQNQLRGASKKSDNDPTGVKNSLKLLLEELDSTVDIDASIRSQLQDQVRSAIQTTSHKEARYLDSLQRKEAVRTQADQRQRLLAQTHRRDDILKSLVEKLNFLMDTQEFLDANKGVAPEVSRIAPHSVLDNTLREVTSIRANESLLVDVYERREQGFVDAMRGVEEANVPFDGVPPLVYPPADVWQALSTRRIERYGSINLAGSGENEQNIYAALKRKVGADFVGTPLQSVLADWESDLGIPIRLNTLEIEGLGLDIDSPVDLSLPVPVSFRSALRMVLKPLELTYIVRNEVLEITSIDDADSDPINKVYPVGDLVISPASGGGMGGMGGGMGGMGGGGMGGMGGGGMGGMGGGGMGGGMGGGGMGGGMFAVPDDSQKSAKRSPLANKTSNSDVDVQGWVARYEEADDAQRLELDIKVRRLIHYKVDAASAYLEAKIDDKAIAEFQAVTDLVGGLLCAGYPQPWMYQTLSLSMEACNYPDADIRRVLLSGLDFGADSDQSLKLAEHFAERGMKEAALALLHDVATIEPYRYDVYAAALPLAAELNDFDSLRWTCLGVLSKAWPKQHAHLYRDADLKARTAEARLMQEGRLAEAEAFRAEVKQAKVRDLAIRVNWSGDADLDIRVQEPAGTICSLSNPSTIAGGVLLGDASSTSERGSIDGYSEYYVCSKGYAGQYDILIRKVWGEVAGGKATVEIYTDFGTDKERVIVKQIDIGEKDAMVIVAVQEGHREQPIAETQLAGIRASQMMAAEAVNAQYGGSEDSTSSADYYKFRRRLAAANAQRQRRGGGFPVGGGAVGYRPVISQINEGANLATSGVVSADRRYVQISPQPFFTGIGEVTTFNFVTGQGGGGGGAGGGNGGLGGGNGGLGGGAGGGQGGGGF